MLLRSELCRRSIRFSLVLRATVVALLVLLLLNLPLLPRGDIGYRFRWESFTGYAAEDGTAEYEPTPDNNEPSGQIGHNRLCPEFPGSDQVVVTVKTGATEASERIPVQMSTSLRCAPNIFIFSDMEQKIGEHYLYDALDSIPSKVTEGNSDFDLYRKQQELKSAGQDASMLKHMGDAAWTLDKYKNLHIVEKAWTMLPDKDWYIHIDADTYIVWPSLLAWLRKLDPSKDLFLGSMTCFGTFPFAHGGSGMLLSRATMRKFISKYNTTSNFWDTEIHDKCCGDLALGQALKACDVDLTNGWPSINGEGPSTIPFGSDHWCKPVVTMHHVTPQDAELLGKFEQRRNKTEPLLFSELFNDLVMNIMPDYLEDWDNMSTGETINNLPSIEDCSKACVENKGCFQFSYNGPECRLSTDTFTLGVPRTPKDGNQWRSTWNKTRIMSWVLKQKPCGRAKFSFKTDVSCG